MFRFLVLFFCVLVAACWLAPRLSRMLGNRSGASACRDPLDAAKQARVLEVEPSAKSEPKQG